MSNRGAINAVTSAARTTTGNSAAISTDYGNSTQLNLLINVTAASGTGPTLDLKVQWSADGTNWADAEPATDTFTQITTAKVVAKQFTVKAPNFRILWTIAGTSPSFTFTADAYIP